MRAITHAIRAERGPFKNVNSAAGTFTTWPSASRPARVGYPWIPSSGSPRNARSSRLPRPSTAASSALTLDEFALWLNLEDDYWTTQGREWIDAVALFGSLLTLSALGKDFFAELIRLALRR